MTNSEPRMKTLISLCVVLLAATAHSQSLTIPERINQGSTGRTRTAPSGRPPSMSEVLDETDAVVRGVLGNPQGYLSEDERNVYSAYPIHSPVFLYQATLGTSPVPGLPPEITVDVIGGTITRNGATFTQRELGLKPMQPGSEVLLFLQRDGDRYRMVGTFWGAFVVSNDTLTPLTTRESFAKEYDGAPADQATQELLTRLRAQRQ